MTTEPTLVCTFRCASRLFGVPLVDIKEVTQEVTITHVPHAPPEVCGLVNIRGQIVLALDLRRLLGMNDTTVLTDQRLIIMKANVGPSFGIIVEEVGEIAAFQADRLELLGAIGLSANVLEDRSALVRGTCQLDHSLLILLEPRKFLPLIETALLANAGRIHTSATS
jgi:purine-binding chemotaxis protein CheW